MTWKSFLLAAALGLVLFPNLGLSQTIYLDCDWQATDPGGNWNTPAYPGTESNLTDFNTGLATTVDVDFSSFGYHGTNGWTVGDIDWVDADAAADFMATNGSSTIVFSDLPGTEYRIELVATRPGSDIGDYSIGGVFANRLHSGSGNSDNWDLNQAHTDGDWMIWDSVAPVSGQITIDVSLVSGNDVTVNAIMLTDVIVPVELLSFSIE